MSDRPMCVVCQRFKVSGEVLCLPCFKSYEKTDGGDMLSVVEWAANRARHFAAKTPPRR